MMQIWLEEKLRYGSEDNIRNFKPEPRALPPLRWHEEQLLTLNPRT